MRDLSPLLSPRSVALVGASQNLDKLNGRPLKLLLQHGFRGKLYPVNPAYTEVAGLRCHPDLASLPESPDLVLLAVPASEVAASMRAAARAGSRAALVLSSGFAEMGEHGARLQNEIADIARASGMSLMGPNTLGFVNAFDAVAATFSQYAEGSLSAGALGFATQSGAFGTAIAGLMKERGLGLGYFVNTGNEADVTLADVLAHMIGDPRIRVAAAYIEGLRDGAAFVEVARRARAAGKPLVVVKVGRTRAGAGAAASHTGALAGEDAVFEGICRQFGVIRARNEEHLLDIAEALLRCPVPRGGGIGVVTMSGGAGVLMADAIVEQGLSLAPLGEPSLHALEAVVPAFGSKANPVDVTAQFVARPEILEGAVRTVLADPAVDIAIVWLQMMPRAAEKLSDLLVRCRDASSDKPLIVSWVAAPEAALSRLRAHGICVARGGDPAVQQAAALAAWGSALQTAEPETSAPFPAPALPAASGYLPTLEAAAILAAFDIPLAASRGADSARAAADAAAALGFPVALKIESRQITHKSDAGGVAMNLRSAQDVEAAYGNVLAAVSRHAPSVAFRDVIVQRQATGRHLELVIGAKTDPLFGPVVMLGMGGIFVELLHDFVFARAPLGHGAARALAGRLRSQALLEGFRGIAPVDLDALAALVCRIGDLATALHPRGFELDLNPVLASGTSLVAVDWRLRLDVD